MIIWNRDYQKSTKESRKENKHYLPARTHWHNEQKDNGNQNTRTKQNQINRPKHTKDKSSLLGIRWNQIIIHYVSHSFLSRIMRSIMWISSYIRSSYSSTRTIGKVTIISRTCVRIIIRTATYTSEMSFVFRISIIYKR